MATPLPLLFWRRTALARLHRLFERTVLAFWRPRAVAPEGGYHIDFDHEGRPLPRQPARIVEQARMVYFFSRLSRSPYADRFADEAARHGIAFLRAALADPVHGGCFFDVRDRTAEPGPVLSGPVPGWWRTKHLFGQAFGLMAMAEFARSFGDAEARAEAERLLALILRHAPDPAGGYHETMARNWSRPGAEHPSLLGPYRGDEKTSNTHLQLLEALLAVQQVLPGPAVDTALADLAAYLDRHAFPHPGQGLSGAAILFADHRDREGRAFLNVGHAVKEVWFRIAALEALGATTPEARAVLRRRFDLVLDLGYDRREGGFWELVTARGPLPGKTWWVQAEGLLGSLIAYRSLGGGRLRGAFLGTLDWIERCQADWVHGEWHTLVEGRTPARRPKGGYWKTAYHTGRALLDGMVVLENL